VNRLTAIVLSVLVTIGLCAAAAGAHGLSASGTRAGVRGKAAAEIAAAQRRLVAAAAATTGGAHGRATTARVPAHGWVGSRLLNSHADDWEPAVAADPHSPYVYMLTTRFTGKACRRHCPFPYLVLTVSSDGGRTWGPQRPLCACRGASTQYDPTIEVVPDTGAVYVAFLNGTRKTAFSTAFMKSTDHGLTWSRPVRVYGDVAWTDKPEVTMDASGEDVYVSWNGPTNGDLYVGQSHDGGSTWTQNRLTHGRRYYYAYDARTLADGTVVFAESSLQYTKGDGVTGQVSHHLVVSRDNGASWTNTVVARVPVGEPCVAAGCGPDFYLGQASVAPVRRRQLLFAYEGPRRNGGPQQVFVVRSNDLGRTWTQPQSLSIPGENATGPRLASTGRGGDVRIWYMQTSGHDDQNAWNVWYRESRNAGRTWSAPVRIDDAPAGAAGYVYAHGFGEIYGDYGEMAVTSAGDSIAVWGEGYSYNGPGGTWFNVQR
jgi:hypothetical protein